MAKPYYTSTELIAAIKRKIAMPITQVTFSEQDLLDFATEELFMSQVPSILQYHEEYYTTSKIIPLVDNISKYDIPNRAIGMKLRDLFYRDTNDNLFEMVNVGPSNSDLFRATGSGYAQPRNYFVQGNEINVMPDIKSGITGSLEMMYYLRPNNLVTNDRAVISNSFVKIITIANANLVAGDTITVGSNVLVADTDFVIGATSTATAANLATAVSSLSGYSATASSSDTSIYFQELDTNFSTSKPTGFVIDTDIGIRCDSIPENLADGKLVDFLQTDGGHNTLAFDIRLGTGSVSNDALYFPAESIPAKFVIGDYICEQYECIIPQIPSDLHTLLAERTCMRIQEALGDTQGVAASQAKVSDMEARQAVLVDNRTEGSPRKIFNRHSLLRAGKNRRFGRRTF